MRARRGVLLFCICAPELFLNLLLLGGLWRRGEEADVSVGMELVELRNAARVDEAKELFKIVCLLLFFNSSSSFACCSSRALRFRSSMA